MNHILIPAAITVLAVGTVWSIIGWVLYNYVESVPVTAGRWVLGTGARFWSVYGFLVSF